MRDVRIYNTLGGEMVRLKPRAPPRISMFVCGITPQKPAHIGHARTAVFFDVTKRFLEFLGYHVFYVQNVTDVEDKILRVATEEGSDWKVVAERNFTDYLGSMDELGVHSVNYYARCTDFIPEIVFQINTLIEKGHAYASEGDVYFDVSSFPPFGKLSGQRLEELEPGARVEVNPKKRAPEDFVLWKQERLGPMWDSPWGLGRPGWHIEDTAITVSVLGPSYDIHGGAMELKFPHHEAEIAQAESATGKSPLAAIWMHAGLLVMHGEKMSKSLGNVLSIREGLKQAGPEVLRFYLLGAHYRSPLDFTGPEALAEAGRSYGTLKGAYDRLKEAVSRSFSGKWKGSDGVEREYSSVEALLAAEYQALPTDPGSKGGDRTLAAMIDALCEDLNVREATASLFTWSSEVNAALASRRENIPFEELVSMIRPFLFAEQVLGYFRAPKASKAGSTLEGLVEVALQARARARVRSDYAEADRIRDQLTAAGIVIEDSANGVKWRLKA